MKLGNRSITNKLVLYFFLVNLIALSLFGILGYLQSKDAITSRTLDQLTSIKNVKKRHLERFFTDISTLIQKITKSKDLLNKPDKSENYYKWGSKGSTISEYIKQNIYFEKAYLALVDNKDTICIEISQDSIFTTKNMFQSINFSTNEIYVYEEILNGTGNDYNLYIVSPIQNEDNAYAGYLMIKLNTTFINEIMLETNPYEGVGNTGESYIVASDGFMRTKSRFIKNSILRLKVESEGFKKSLSGINGTGFYKDYRGIDVLGSFGKLDINGLNWNILVEIDFEEANKPIIKMRNKLTILMFIFSSIILFVTYFLSKKFTLPIITLTNAVRKIGQGIYPEPIEVNGENEIALLSHSFNNMTNKLKIQEAELERERLNRAQIAIDALDEERNRLSRELHDGLGQLMIATKLKLENINIADIESNEEKLKDVKSSIDRIIEETRHISNNLMPSVLSEFGISNAIRFLCDEMNGFAGTKIIFETNFKNEILTDREQIYFFRIAQESLKNALQHSSATKIHISLTSNNNIIKLQIMDNGKGFGETSIFSGNGIYNMKERAKLIGAKLTFDNYYGEGASITLTLTGVKQK